MKTHSKTHLEIAHVVAQAFALPGLTSAQCLQVILARPELGLMAMIAWTGVSAKEKPMTFETARNLRSYAEAVWEGKLTLKSRVARSNQDS